MLSALYAAAVRRRRERYAARPDLRRRLRRPVVSIGNLAVGGRGKTPIAETIARLLLQMGERPAILSRGYGRARPEDGVVVVRDPIRIRADLGRAGDEPLMLARKLPGVSVLACPDRYLAGRLAEHHLHATVHVLDDGFQHLQLERDIDLLILARQDIEHPVTLPFGRLREPLDTLVAADAVLTADDDVVVHAAGRDLPVFPLQRRVDAGGTGDDGRAAPTAPAVALAGIAAPERFFGDLRRAGWTIAGTVSFPDHHRYTRRDVQRVSELAAARGARQIVTTEKDFVRLLPLRPFTVPVTYVRIVVEPTPLDEFRAWLHSQLAAVRGALHG